MARSYRQYCGLARALDLVGERWTLLLVRELLLGPKRFSDLLEGLPGITTNLLTKRLRSMEAAGLVARTVLPAPARVAVYGLTDTGRALEPALMELARFGGRTLGTPRRGERMNVAWGLLSMKRRYLGGLSLEVELSVDERVFTVSCEPSYLLVEERAAGAPRCRLRTTTPGARALFFAGAPSLARAVELGVQVEGDTSDAARFLSAFSAPPHAPPPKRPTAP